MPFDVSNVKWACEGCIKGHRSSTCLHFHKPMMKVQKAGRPGKGNNQKPREAYYMLRRTPYHLRKGEIPDWRCSQNPDQNPLEKRDYRTGLTTAQSPDLIFALEAAPLTPPLTPPNSAFKAPPAAPSLTFTNSAFDTLHNDQAVITHPTDDLSNIDPALLFLGTSDQHYPEADQRQQMQATTAKDEFLDAEIGNVDIEAELRDMLGSWLEQHARDS